MLTARMVSTKPSLNDRLRDYVAGLDATCAQFANAPLGDVLPTPATVQRELLSTGKLDYADLDGEPTPAWVNLLSRSLNLNTTLRVTLTGAQAEAWREQLVKAGVRAARLEVGTQPAAGLHVELIR